MVGSVAAAFPTFQNLSDYQLLGILLGLTILFAFIARFLFRYCEHIAQERGLIDMVTNY
jgi:hypothetical protein